MGITLNEAILVAIIDADDIDGTNVIFKFRKAQQNLATEIQNAGVRLFDFDVAEYDVDWVDGMMIRATANGKKAIWS